jgi:hypothetical protein
MKLKLNAILLALLAVVGLWSCGSKGDQSKSADEFADAEKSLKEEIKDIAYTIPPPGSIPGPPTLRQGSVRGIS